MAMWQALLVLLLQTSPASAGGPDCSEPAKIASAFRSAFPDQPSVDPERLDPAQCDWIRKEGFKGALAVYADLLAEADFQPADDGCMLELLKSAQARCWTVAVGNCDNLGTGDCRACGKRHAGRQECMAEHAHFWLRNDAAGTFFEIRLDKVRSQYESLRCSVSRGGPSSLEIYNLLGLLTPKADLDANVKRSREGYEALRESADLLIETQGAKWLQDCSFLSREGPIWRNGIMEAAREPLAAAKADRKLRAEVPEELKAGQGKLEHIQKLSAEARSLNRTVTELKKQGKNADTDQTKLDALFGEISRGLEEAVANLEKRPQNMDLGYAGRAAAKTLAQVDSLVRGLPERYRGSMTDRLLAMDSRLQRSVPSPVAAPPGVTGPAPADEKPAESPWAASWRAALDAVNPWRIGSRVSDAAQSGLHPIHEGILAGQRAKAAEGLMRSYLAQGGARDVFIRQLDELKKLETLRFTSPRDYVAVLRRWQAEADTSLERDKPPAWKAAEDAGRAELAGKLVALQAAAKALETSGGLDDSLKASLEKLARDPEGRSLSPAELESLRQAYGRLSDNPAVRALESALRSAEAAGKSLDEVYAGQAGLAEYHRKTIESQDFYRRSLADGLLAAGTELTPKDLGWNLPPEARVTVALEQGRPGYWTRGPGLDPSFQSLDKTLVIQRGKDKAQAAVLLVKTFGQDGSPLGELILDETGKELVKTTYQKEGERTVRVVEDFRKKMRSTTRVEPDGRKTAVIEDLAQGIVHEGVDENGQAAHSHLAGMKHKPILDGNGKLIGAELVLADGSWPDLEEFRPRGWIKVDQAAELLDVFRGQLPHGASEKRKTSLLVGPDGRPKLHSEFEPEPGRKEVADLFYQNDGTLAYHHLVYWVGREVTSERLRIHRSFQAGGRPGGERWAAVEEYQDRMATRYSADNRIRSIGNAGWALHREMTYTKYKYNSQSQAWEYDERQVPEDDNILNWAGSQLSWVFENTGLKYAGKAVGWVADRGKDFGYLVSGASARLLGSGGDMDNIVYRIVTEWQAPGMQAMVDNPSLAVMSELRRHLSPKDYEHFVEGYRDAVRKDNAKEALRAGKVLEAASWLHGGGEVTEEEIGSYLIFKSNEGFGGAGRAFAERASDSKTVGGKAANFAGAVLVYAGDFTFQSLGFQGFAGAAQWAGDAAKAAGASRTLRAADWTVEHLHGLQEGYFKMMLAQQGLDVSIAASNGDKQRVVDSLAQITGMVLAPMGDQDRLKTEGASSGGFKAIGKEILTTSMLAQKVSNLRNLFKAGSGPSPTAPADPHARAKEVMDAVLNDPRLTPKEKLHVLLGHPEVVKAAGGEPGVIGDPAVVQEVYKLAETAGKTKVPPVSVETKRRRVMELLDSQPGTGRAPPAVSDPAVLKRAEQALRDVQNNNSLTPEQKLEVLRTNPDVRVVGGADNPVTDYLHRLAQKAGKFGTGAGPEEQRGFVTRLISERQGRGRGEPAERALRRVLEDGKLTARQKLDALLADADVTAVVGIDQAVTDAVLEVAKAAEAIKVSGLGPSDQARALMDLVITREEALEPPRQKAKGSPPLPVTEEMSANQRLIDKAVREIPDLRENPDAGVFVKNLEPAKALPPDLAARTKAIAERMSAYMGVEITEVVPPKTKPLSGAEVFYLMSGESVVGVYKVWSGEKADITITNELHAGKELGSRGLKESAPIDSLGAWKLGDGQVGYLMKAAPGMDYFGIFKELGNTPRGPPRLKARERTLAAVRALGKAMAELYNSGSDGKTPMPREFKENSISYARENLKKLREGFKTEEDGKTVKVPEKLMNAMSERLERYSKDFLDKDVPGGLAHGDGHPGNFFFESQSGKLTMIDLETAVRSFGPDGKGINSPYADVGRFVEVLRWENEGKKLNLDPHEIKLIEDTLLDAFNKEIVSIPPEAVQAHLRYYRARMQVTALSYAKTAAQFNAILDAVSPDLLPPDK